MSEMGKSVSLLTATSETMLSGYKAAALLGDNISASSEGMCA